MRQYSQMGFVHLHTASLQPQLTANAYQVIHINDLTCIIGPHQLLFLYRPALGSKNHGQASY